MVKYVSIGLAIVFIVFVGWFFFFGQSALAPTKTPLENLPHTDAGVPPSTPSFTYVNASADLIRISSPKPGDSVGQTIRVAGEARGPWFFEASFPVQVIDESGTVIGEAPARAEGDSMTNNFVTFTAGIVLTTPYTGSATVILKKDNPSGDPSRDASVSFPVTVTE